MQLVSTRILRYRCLEDVSIDFYDLTSLIGENGSGKSAILRAIGAFYDEGDLVGPEDWYASDHEKDIEISLSFASLNDAEKDAFTRYVSSDGILKVSRVWHLLDGRVRDSLHGYHLACEDFQPLREATRGVAALHNTLVESKRYEGLERVSRQDDVEDALRRWESAHPARCAWIRDSGKFFGWRQVGGARLRAASTCVYVPAVRDARDDAAQGRGSVLSQVVDLVLKAELATNPDLRALREKTEMGFSEVLQTARPTLTGLAQELSELMKEFAADSGVVLDWSSDVPVLPDWPPIEARLVDDGVETPVGTKGHGLQRSFIVSLLQRLAQARSAAVDDKSRASAHTIFLIEEPELYQHPLAARQFAKVLRRLVAHPHDVQVMYSTHHPQFIEFDHFDSIRILRKLRNASVKPPTTSANSYSLTAVSTKLAETWDLHATDVTEQSTRDRLRTVLTPRVSEGFFAKAVILVEGTQDEAILEGYATATGRDLTEKGIGVVPVGGKSNLDRPLIVFSGFNIPCYAIWDGDASNPKDRERNARENRALCHLTGLVQADFPQTVVGDRGAIFSDKLETELASAVGDRYAALLDKAAGNVALSRSRDLLKTRYGCHAFVDLLKTAEIDIPVLEELFAAVLRLTR